LKLIPSRKQINTFATGLKERKTMADNMTMDNAGQPDAGQPTPTPGQAPDMAGMVAQMESIITDMAQKVDDTTLSNEEKMAIGQLAGQIAKLKKAMQYNGHLGNAEPQDVSGLPGAGGRLS
jgi:hypothetical protein